MSDISSLRARLSQEEARNRELRGELAELGAGVANAGRRMSEYNTKVQQTMHESANRINISHENIIKSHELQLEINQMYVRFKNMEMANKKIRECNNKKYYEFANYTTIRKIVQGMLDNLNLHMISDEIIYKSIEKEHLKTPDYWLTSVLLSIMAWKNDDKALADRAVGISVKLDKKNSAIFYMLFNIRMHREEAALKWFYLYQECDLKGGDDKTFLMLFSMLSKTLHDDIDDKVKYEVIDYINKVIGLTVEREGFEEAQMVDKIEAYLKRMRDSDDIGLNMLKRCLTDYSDVADTIMLAKNNVNILQFILDVGNVSEIERNEYLDQFINDEIAKPNEAELAVYDEIEYNEMIIACNGDMELAKERYGAQQEKKERELNLIAEMIEWIYKKGQDEEVNGQIRKNMFILTAAMQKEAVDQYTEHYRSRVKNVHPVVLGDYSTDVNFEDSSREKQKIVEHYEEERAKELSQIKYMTSIIGGVLGVVGIVSIFFIGMVGALISGVGVAMVLYNILSNNRQKKHIFETCELNIRNKSELLEQLLEEYRNLMQIYTEYDAYTAQIGNALGQF